ncbi:rhomboid family intramembrane serine protease [Lacibacter sediminis]|uniref:Rhomboid family intramembrane serine protease n=1 Tax=Lacibacter sediminis TaxID=2760713 RepID=A0A7G5XLU4_9BACT|nr:rhomboid family intramembrane serine protease [Lacibacter sediminis]QNA46447.1 rhomboid family intramembrane serine protease [Lacibacter sediminis]
MDFTITVIIIIITCIISFTAFSSEKIINDLIFWPPMIQEKKQFYRFITSGLIHADIPHLAFNMITLYFFGRLVEEYLFIPRIGKTGYLLFYIAGIIVSEIPSYIKHRNNYSYRSLGASGAVTAVLFSFILLAPWQTIYVFFLPVPAIIFAALYVGYSIYMDRKGGDNVNHSAHLWGAAWGVVFTLLMEPDIINRFIDQLMHPNF